MCFIQRNNGDVDFDQEEIIEETKNFYVNLYSQQETIDVDMKRVAPNAPLLTMENREITEGQITYTEAHIAVRAMTNNKSPGSDGYTSELKKKIFRDIAHFLVRSINYRFKNKQMSVTPKQGIITCISKEGKPKHLLKNWRPISLLNTAYKIASSCIANRLVAKTYSRRSERIYERKIYW